MSVLPPCARIHGGVHALSSSFESHCKRVAVHHTSLTPPSPQPPSPYLMADDSNLHRYVVIPAQTLTQTQTQSLSLIVPQL